MSYKVTNWRNQPQIDDLNNIFEKIQEVIDSGVAGNDGADGDNGWTPELAVEAYEGRRVLKVVGWLGGQGESPSTGFYVAENGFTENIENAVDIRGEQGVQGIDGDAGADGADGVDGEDGAQGEDGVGLVFNWNGTELGIAREDDFFMDFDFNRVYNYEYVDLKGDAGAQGADGLQGEQGEAGVGVPAGGATGEVLQKLSGDDYDTGWATPSGGGSSAFTGLTDTPSAYTDNAGKVVSVNSTEDGLEFIDAPSGGGGGGADQQIGTFTPVLYDFNGGSPLSVTYTQQLGSYIRVGNLVFIQASIRWGNASERSPFSVGGFPFPPSTDNINSIAVSVGRYQNDEMPNLASLINGSGETTRDGYSIVGDFARQIQVVRMRCDAPTNIVPNVSTASGYVGIHLSFCYIADLT